ncbi:hypothetical protein KIN20_024656 [Parelaphostrongylus tenuis]|uniref:Uncharacterized protein n=1 Tax=Parelaphostrongylus tenuis TaxID=148309 RepID=A0AAD5MTT8_PARTN|nr:hypothetical protein KIN20_024656 [Parelaphostrongylus tenuis]
MTDRVAITMISIEVVDDGRMAVGFKRDGGKWTHQSGFCLSFDLLIFAGEAAGSG